jgi:hypothetical protein
MASRIIRYVCLVSLLAVAASAPAWAGRQKTGVLEKKKVDGKDVEVFSDTAYGYSLTTPDGWDFSLQKEEGPALNPLRVRMRMKDKQVPSQLWDAQNLVTNAQIYLFIVDVDWTPAMVRDSLAASRFNAEWQKPIVKYCDLLRDGQPLQSMDIRWENNWLGAGCSVQKQYQAQVPTGDGLFTSVQEVLLGEFYVFTYKGHKLIVHLVSEREFLEANRNVVKETLYQLGPLEP